MHSLAITFVAVASLIVSLAGLAPSSGPLVLLLAIGVCLIGMPHGSLDHLAFRRLIRRPTPLAMLLFFTLYLAVAAIVIAGWYVSPLACVLVFFALSAWHFGLEEDERSSRSSLQQLAMVARGGMVIWAPALFQPAAMTDLLSMVLPIANSTTAALVVELVAAASPALIALTLFDLWSFENPVETSRTEAARWELFDLATLHCVRVAALFALFAVANPLVSFGVYFCGWHSIRGLKHLHEEFSDAGGNFVVRLVPISIAALLLMLGGLVYWSSVDSFTPALVRTLFVGLSAVAVPHLLLHVVVDLLNHKSTDKLNRQSVSGVLA